MSTIAGTEASFRRIARIALAIAAALLITAVMVRHAAAQTVPAASEPDAAGKFYLPLVNRDTAMGSLELSDRLGYGASGGSILSYPDIRALNAGWYLDWSVKVKPPRPAGIELAQMVRVHQKLTCPYGTTADRVKCPYATPYRYEYSPDRATIEAAAKANPGAIWLIGNEMDRLDWGDFDNPNDFGGRQDEMLPEVYAQAYHDLHLVIKNADPKARVAIGGVIQFTPLREQYLNKIWDTYFEKYKVNMPVDVWNIHNFVAPEFCRMEDGERICYGMAIPPGETPDIGAYYGQNWVHVDRATFDAQIRGFRAWMKNRGQMNKPLIITEYGVLYYRMCGTVEGDAKCKTLYGDKYQDLQDPNVIHDFMIWTFDYFANTKDCTLSGLDDCRLVQRWTWFSLEETAGWGFNQHGALMDGPSKAIRPAGQRFRDYSLANWRNLQMP
jgi:hypothetical protein